MQLAAAHVLVTGASRGIGALIAARSASLGATVTAVARRSRALDAHAAAIGAHALPTDLAVPAERRALVARAEAAAGRPVDVLVNAAGVDAVGSVLAIDADGLQRVFEVNLLAAAELCRQALPGMVTRRRGHVVNVSSGYSAVVTPGLTPYSASKAGLSHFTAGLRAELAGTGVGTTLVELGPVSTAMYGGIQEHAVAGAALRRFLRLRLIAELSAEDVAGSIVRAVELGRPHVVLPRRLALVMAFGRLPRRASQLLLSGLPKR